MTPSDAFKMLLIAYAAKIGNAQLAVRRTIRNTLHARLAVRLAALAISAGVLLVLFVFWTARAQAAPVGFGQGCETVHWGFLGGQRRTVCDGPKRADGSWDREREIWVPAGVVNGYCYFGTWSSSCSPSYYRQRSTVSYEQYPVSDAPGAVNPPLADEPGWLPPGTVRIL